MTIEQILNQTTSFVNTIKLPESAGVFNGTLKAAESSGNLELVNAALLYNSIDFGSSSSLSSSTSLIFYQNFGESPVPLEYKNLTIPWDNSKFNNTAAKYLNNVQLFNNDQYLKIEFTDLNQKERIFFCGVEIDLDAFTFEIKSCNEISNMIGYEDGNIWTKVFTDVQNPNTNSILLAINSFKNILYLYTVYPEQSGVANRIINAKSGLAQGCGNNLAQVSKMSRTILDGNNKQIFSV
jgi:hypothetical protein